jgi:hypothetical protein
MPYGITPTGFNRKTTEIILQEIEDDQRANILATLNVSAPSPIGQVNGIFASKLGEVWEGMQEAYDAWNPDNSGDFSLTSLSAVTGTQRNDSTRSVVECSVTLTAGTYAVGALVAVVTGNTSARFRNRDEIVSAGVLLYTFFESEDFGPIAAPNNSLVIGVPVSGWTTITSGAVTLGKLIESDPDLRIRREAELGGQGSNNVRAVRAALSRLTGMQSVQAFENYTDAYDENGLPPHSFECVLFDGLSPAVLDNDIAQAIWDHKACGIRAFGLTAGTAIDDVGESHIVYFTRVTIRDVWVEMDLDIYAPGYAGDDVVKEAVAAFPAQIGQAITIKKLESIAVDVAGVEDITATRVGFSASPTNTLNLAVGTREIAAYSVSRIVVVTS